MAKKNSSPGQWIRKAVQSGDFVKKGGYQSGKPNSSNRVPPQGASPTKPVSSGDDSGKK